MGKRLQRLSSRFLGPYRWALYAVYISLFTSIAVASFWRSSFFGITQAGIYGYFFYRLIRMTKKLQQVSFDNEFLYVFLKDQDMIVPLQNIESVEISSLGGVYKVNLYHAEQLGDHFYFKTSLLYPLNYKTKDALVNQLRTAIDRAKSRREDIQKNALHS